MKSSKRDEAEGKLHRVKAWEQLKTGIDAALEDLGNAYKKAAAEFSKYRSVTQDLKNQIETERAS